MKEFLDIDLSDSRKAKYLSRLFGIFYEDLIRFCMKEKGFTFLGRPSVYKKGKYTRKTFDYTFKNKKNGKKYIAEAKCWIQYQNFRYIELTYDLLKKELYDQSNKKSFELFLDLGSERKPYKSYKFKYYDMSKDEKEEFLPDGKILFWTKFKKSDLAKIKKVYNLSYIFSIEDLINEIKKLHNNSDEYHKHINEILKWTEEMFNEIY